MDKHNRKILLLRMKNILKPIHIEAKEFFLKEVQLFGNKTDYYKN